MPISLSREELEKLTFRPTARSLRDVKTTPVTVSINARMDSQFVTVSIRDADLQKKMGLEQGNTYISTYTVLGDKLILRLGRDSNHGVKFFKQDRAKTFHAYSMRIGMVPPLNVQRMLQHDVSYEWLSDSILYIEVDISKEAQEQLAAGDKEKRHSQTYRDKQKALKGKKLDAVDKTEISVVEGTVFHSPFPAKLTGEPAPPTQGVDKQVTPHPEPHDDPRLPDTPQPEDTVVEELSEDVFIPTVEPDRDKIQEPTKLRRPGRKPGSKLTDNRAANKRVIEEAIARRNVMNRPITPPPAPIAKKNNGGFSAKDISSLSDSDLLISGSEFVYQTQRAIITTEAARVLTLMLQNQKRGEATGISEIHRKRFKHSDDAALSSMEETSHWLENNVDTMLDDCNIVIMRLGGFYILKAL